MDEQRKKLELAEQRSKELFDAVEKRGLIVAGKSELELSEEIVKLAKEDFNITEYWHKKIVRAGINTVHSFSVDPPDLIIQHDDIVFLDFGFIIDGYEADLGRTFVLGNNALKIKIKQDAETIWDEVNLWISKQTSLTGAACFQYITEISERYGWSFGGEIGGHIVGPYPHEQAGDGNWSLDIHPNNRADIFDLDRNGNKRNWILEIQLTDPKHKIGSFIEQLMY